MQVNKRSSGLIKKYAQVIPSGAWFNKTNMKRISSFFWRKSLNSSAEIADLRNEPLKKTSARGKSHGKWLQRF